MSLWREVLMTMQSHSHRGFPWLAAAVLAALWLSYCGRIVRDELRHEQYCAEEVRMARQLYKEIPEVAHVIGHGFFADVHMMGCNGFEDIPIVDQVKYWRSMIEAHAWIAAYPIAFCLLMMFARLLARKVRG
jgi:hypothetical protein